MKRGCDRMKLKDITPLDRYIYSIAMNMEQPFSPTELLQAIQDDEREWKIGFIKYRCKKYRKQKMLKRIGIFRNVKYKCLVTQDDMENAIYEYSPIINVSNSSFFCGL